MADITSIAGLNNALFNDGSFSDFINSVDDSLLSNPDFVSALNSIDPSLMTDGRFTNFLSEAGGEIVLDGSFVRFASLISRSLLSDGSFSAFLNGVDKSVLTNGGFTETLLSLGESVLSSGNFTEALLSINAEILKNPSFQEALRRIDPEVLTGDRFEGFFNNGTSTSEIRVESGGVVTINGVRVAGDEVSGDISNTLTNNALTDTPDSLLTGGSASVRADSEAALTAATTAIGDDVAKVDDALRAFISGEEQTLSLAQPTEMGVAGNGLSLSSNSAEIDTLLASLDSSENSPLEQSTLGGLTS